MRIEESYEFNRSIRAAVSPFSSGCRKTILPKTPFPQLRVYVIDDLVATGGILSTAIRLLAISMSCTHGIYALTTETGHDFINVLKSVPRYEFSCRRLWTIGAFAFSMVLLLTLHYNWMHHSLMNRFRMKRWECKYVLIIWILKFGFRFLYYVFVVFSPFDRCLDKVLECPCLAVI
ncbi:hypothetical protein ACH5RR_003262 [Cinchona calisaya]|uniref:Uncharacterized protein n=1 Tax=Cinchona calisaya TaxID=153742 RepID=A0ABD3AUN5_9GENT